MEIHDILKKTGLNDKESQVYMALLELGTATVELIAKKAETKRPTTYLILDSLQEKGLVGVIPRAKKSLYTAESPERIVADLGRKQELVKRFLPQMLALYNTRKEKPKVLLFEGKNAVSEVYEKILDAKDVSFFATIKDIAGVYPDYPKRLMETTLDKKTKVRELLTQNPEDIAFAKTITHSDFYEHRFIPAGSSFLTDNVLFDDNIVFFSYEPYIFAVQIQSRAIYQSLLTLFEMAWHNAKKYEEVIK